MSDRLGKERVAENENIWIGNLVRLTSILVVVLLAQSAVCYAEKPKASAMQCPSMDFQDFLREFVSDESVQRAFTKIPLRKRAVDFGGASEPKAITTDLTAAEVEFPVFPLKPERKVNRFSLSLEDITSDSPKAVIYKTDTAFQVSYRFEKSKCWMLVSIDDQTYSKGGKVVSNWLDYLFPSVTQCTPRSFYYDAKSKRSNSGLLETLGYKPYKVDGRVARYRVHETFFGYDATEIAIPVDADLFEISVKASADRLSIAMQSALGKSPRVVNKYIKHKNATAYIVPVGDEESVFVCSTFED